MQRWREIAARICGLAAALFLLAMMLLTVADVTLRAAFNTPIRGVYELVELLLACTFFVALPAAFLREDNILVNVIDNLAPRWVPALERVAAVIAAVVLATMVWQGFLAARDSLEFHDVTADLGLSRVYHWTAVLVGIAGALVAALLVVIRGNGRR